MTQSSESRGWRTVLCGFGSVAAGIGQDKRMARYIKYQTHAQVLREHPDFNWQAVVDPDPVARRAAKEDWAIPIVVAHPDEMPVEFQPEVIVLTTSPEPRTELIEAFPNIQALVVEKPLGETFAQSVSFAKLIEDRKIHCQVNLFRRTDRTYQELLANGFMDQIGAPQAATIIYGNGLLNNGLHMIDLVRLLLGEIMSVQALGPAMLAGGGMIPGDIDIVCCLTLGNGAVVTMHPLNFEHYRDVMLDVWGTRGRLEIFQEGLRLRHSPLKDHRAIEGSMEIAIDDPIDLKSYCGTAYYQLYNDLSEALYKDREPKSPIGNALRSEAVVDAIRRSAQQNGNIIKLEALSSP